MVKGTTQEVARTDSANVPAKIDADNETLASIETVDDVERYFMGLGVDLINAADTLGDGFAVAEKDRLIGVPFVILQWRFVQGDFGEFVAAHIVTRDAVDGNNKFVIVDGSTGIFEQLRIFEQKYSRNGGLVCRHGLRVSEYEYTDEKTGQTRPARTFYIDTAA